MERIQQLEQELQQLREEVRQAERLRRMWQEAVGQLKRTRADLLAAQQALQASNSALEERVAELGAAKHTLERLAYSDEQVIENMQEGLVVTDASGTILAVNPAFCATTGYSAEEVIGHNPRLLRSGRHEDGFYQVMWRALSQHGRWQGEIWNQRKNGEIYPELLSISALRDWRDDTINYIGVFTDITSSKQAEEALRASQEQLAAVTALLSDGVVMLDTDERITFANPEACRLTGRPLAELLEHRHTDVLKTVEPRGPFLLPPGSTVRTLIDEHEPAEFEDLHLIRRDSTTLPIALASSPIIQGERIVGAVAAFHDVSRRKSVEEQLLKLSRAVEHSPAMVVITDLQGSIEYVNPRFTELTGYAPEEVVGQSTAVLKSGRTAPELYSELWETIRSGRDWHGEFLNRTKSGELFWMMVSISPIVDAEGNITHFVSVEEDITERKRTEEKIWYQANYDSLTGLPNRRLFHDRLHQALTHALVEHRSGALMFIDLDRFKYVNDTLGHDAGDELLLLAARRLGECVSEADTVSRLGGDEFTVILPTISSAHRAEGVAQAILEALTIPVALKGQELLISGSIGIALFPEDGETVEELLKRADSAMYRAKDRGRNTFVFYTEEVNELTLRKIAIETELRRALEREELEVVFQPILDLAGGEPAAMEALLRWQNARLGAISPATFVPIAEAAGLMPAIGEWVLIRACDEAASWHNRSGLEVPVSVNISLAQLKHEEFPGRVRAILAESGLPPALLILEVTESMVMDEPTHYITQLERLSALGVQVAIDDFGTGYSSLSYLKQMRAQTLKIDQSFVRDLPRDGDDATIVRTVIAMAHHLNMRVTAEGVEHEDQLAFLREAGCDRSQGFLHAKPMAAAEVVRWLAQFKT